MSIGIIGYGVVGQAAAKTFKKSYDVFKYDKFTSLDTFEEIAQCDFVLVSVPTPFDCSKNIVNDQAVVESLNKLKDLNFRNIVIIKSTLPPGFCDSYSKTYDFSIVFNPEFLRESTTPNEDFKNQDTVVIGANERQIFDKTKKMYEKVLIEDAKYFFTNFKEAEMIKVAQNTMLASRVALANMFFDACEEHNLDYAKIKKIGFDLFDIIGPHMSQVPGPDGSRGFGGKCLPKDIRAFSTIFKSSLLMEIINYNDGLRSDLDAVLQNFKR